MSYTPLNGLGISSAIYVPYDANDRVAYKFDEARGALTSVSSGNISSSLLDLTKNLAGSNRLGYDGIFGNCLDVVGTQWASNTDLSSLSVNFPVVSVTAWIRARTFPAALNSAYIVTKNSANDLTSTLAWAIGLSDDGGGKVGAPTGSGQIAVRLRNGAGLQSNCALQSALDFMSANRWSLLAFTYDGASTVKLYKDGILADTDAAFTGPLNYGTHGPFVFGGYGAPANFGDCFIDDVRIADVERPASYFLNMFESMHPYLACGVMR